MFVTIVLVRYYNYICERSFSKHSIIKNELRGTICHNLQEMLDDLLFLFVEQKLLFVIDLNDDIIEFKIVFLPNNCRHKIFEVYLHIHYTCCT